MPRFITPMPAADHNVLTAWGIHLIAGGIDSIIYRIHASKDYIDQT